jgi:hypothetical protein
LNLDDREDPHLLPASNSPSTGKLPWRSARSILAGLLVLTAGCGLSDYENRMDSEQARIKKFDEDNKNLEDAAELPSDAHVFFRPPAGMKKTFEKDLVDNLLRVLPPQSKGEIFQEVDLAWSTDPKEDLEAKVWNALKVSPQKLAQEKVGEKSGHKGRIFDKAAYTAGDSAYYVYFYKEGSYRVVVIFKFGYKEGETDPGKVQTARSLIDLSLSTLAVGQLAVKRKNAFRPRRSG